MAQTEFTRPQGAFTPLRTIWSALGDGLAAYMDRASRVERINRLNALSDAELAKLGITRDRIPYHVFRDVFHL